jgi:hypothetical protein
MNGDSVLKLSALHIRMPRGNPRRRPVPWRKNCSDGFREFLRNGLCKIQVYRETERWTDDNDYFIQADVRQLELTTHQETSRRRSELTT